MIDNLWNFLQSQIQTNQLSQAAILSAVGLGLWRYASAIPLFLWHRLDRLIRYSVTIEQEDDLHRYFNVWVEKHIPQKLRKVEATLRGDQVGLSHENDYVYIWRNMRRLTISKTKQRLEAANSSDNMFNRTYNITGLFAKKVIQDLIQECIEEGQEYDKMRVLRKTKPDVYVSNEWGGWNYSEGSGKTFNNLYLSQKGFILQDLDNFKARQKLYEQIGVSYKRGYLLHGKPGNGKSSLAYAIAAYMNYDIYSLDLSGMTANNFNKAIKAIPNYSVLVIEDIDAFYRGREALKDNKVSFSTFLNALSGVAQMNNLITVITTNIIEFIDPALRRDGRCDVDLYLDNPTKEMVEDFVSKIFKVPMSIPNYQSRAFSAVQGVVFKNLEDVNMCIKELSTIVKKPKKQIKESYSTTGSDIAEIIYEPDKIRK